MWCSDAEGYDGDWWPRPSVADVTILQGKSQAVFHSWLLQLQANLPKAVDANLVAVTIPHPGRPTFFMSDQK